MKKILVTLFLSAVALACSAFAADAVVNSAGTVVYGTGAQLLSVEKDTCCQRILLKYSSGFQYVSDDANYTRYAKAVSAMGSNGVAVPGTSRVYDISKSNGIYCQSSQSVIAWPNASQPEYIADGCQFWQAAKAVAQ